MRTPKNSFLWLSGLTLLALPAAAQTPDYRPGDDPRTMQEERSVREVRTDRTRVRVRSNDLSNAPHLLKVSELLGSDVMDRGNKKLGELEDLVVNVRTGQVMYAAISAGGFLGVGGRTYAVPMRSLNWEPREERMSSSLTEDQLKTHFRLDNTWPARFEADRNVGNVEHDRDVVRLSKLKGLNVRDQRAQEIGKVEDVVIDVRAGEIAYAVLKIERLDGREDALFAIPLVSLQATGEDRVIIQAQRQDFRIEERLNEGRWPTRAVTLVHLDSQRSQFEQDSWRQDTWRQDRQQDTWRQDRQDDQQTWRQDRQDRQDDQQTWRRDRQDDQQTWRQDRQDDQQTWRQDRQETWRQDRQETWRQDQQRDRQPSQQETWRQDRQTWGQQDRMRTGDDMMLVAFAAAEDKSVRGSVESVRHDQGKCVISVKTADGETITALVAPQDYLRQEGMELREGQRISLTGKQVFVPTRIVMDNRTVQLRDERGQARWQEDRMDFDRTRAREAGFGRQTEEDKLSKYLSGAPTERFGGQIANLTRRSLEQTSYLVMVLRDQRGNTREVALVEVDRLSTHDLGASTGDRAEVEAVKAHIDGREIWVGKSVMVDGRRVQLRDPGSTFGQDPQRRDFDRQRNPDVRRDFDDR